MQHCFRRWELRWGNKLDKQIFLYAIKKKGGGAITSLFNFIYVEIISDVEKSGVGWGEGVVMIFA